MRMKRVGRRVGLVLLLTGFGIASTLGAESSPFRAAKAEPLLDWSAWENYRSTVRHPSGAVQPADLVRARENIRRYAWARNYSSRLETTAQAALRQLTPEMVEHLIPETTPGDQKFTPCPACRDQGKPVHPHGQWSWRAAVPDQIACKVCQTVFPHENYPETVVLQSRWGRPQSFTFYGGDPFVIFSYLTGRPSFSANIRAHQVAYMAELARSMGEAYLLTGNTDFARGVRTLLLRFAHCYPHWLVHCGYGEYADMDPRIAAQFINQLPEPELCVPPNQPDHRLHTGYWSAGRASGVGQESGFVRRMVEAYDFTCEARDASGYPVYTDTERRTIERDLLLEGTVLLVCDKQINNKSVGNRTAAALVGLCVGHPGLVQFGWEGFQQTVDGWFLPDGTTPESPAYATMTLGNSWDTAQALRGYSDPPGYRDAAGKRVDALDPYHETAYERVWHAMFQGLQGDLLYPSFADSYRDTGLRGNFVELMAANYPDRPEYLALLKATCGPDLDRGYAPLALYYRPPGLETKPAPGLAFADWLSPALRIGHLRTGVDGRESLLLLSASDWGAHHHQDSLNLYYWKQGAELLSDLGYLWDHPQKHQTARTVAHNTVLIDGKDQATKERGGEIAFFKTSEHVKVMEASSHAYPAAKLYRRTSAIIEHGGGRNYVVDFFRVEGGRTQDYVYHAAASTSEVADLKLAAMPSTKIYDFASIRSADGAGVWRMSWRASADITAVAWNVGQPGEHAFVADGWGQRDWKNSDRGATLPYVVRRHEGDGLKTFITVFEGYAGEPFVRSVKFAEETGVLAVATVLGTDYVMSARDTGSLTLAAAPGQPLAGRFVVASVQKGTIAWSFVQPEPHAVEDGVSPPRR